MIELHTDFGIDLTSGDTRVLSMLSQPKRLALLVFLLVEGDTRRIRRDELCALFWPELDQVRARANLRQALHFIRRSLGVDVFSEAVDEEVAFEPGRIRWVGSGGHRFLEGFHFDGASRSWEEWVDGLRASPLRKPGGVPAEPTESSSRTASPATKARGQRIQLAVGVGVLCLFVLGWAVSLPRATAPTTQIPVIVAHAEGPDSALAELATALLRIWTEGGGRLVAVSPLRLAAERRNAGIPLAERISLGLAKQVALRTAAWVVAPTVARSGQRVTLSGRLIDPTDGSVEASHVVAVDSVDLAGGARRVLQSLAGSLRPDVGFRSGFMVTDLPLSTKSHQAAMHVMKALEGDLAFSDRGAALGHIDQAIAADTAFAAAWALQALLMRSFSTHVSSPRWRSPLRQAHALREGGTRDERLFVEAAFTWLIDRDVVEAVELAEGLRATAGSPAWSAVGAYLMYEMTLEWPYRTRDNLQAWLAIEQFGDSTFPSFWRNAFVTQLQVGDWAKVDRTLELWEARMQGTPGFQVWFPPALMTAGRYGEALRALERPGETRPHVRRSRIATFRGQLGEAVLRDSLAATERPRSRPVNSLHQAMAHLYLADDTVEARRRLESVVADTVFWSMNPWGHTYPSVAYALAVVGRPGAARPLLSRFLTVTDPSEVNRWDYLMALAEVEWQEGEQERGVSLMVRADRLADGVCGWCVKPRLGSMLERMGRHAEAARAYRAYVENRWGRYLDTQSYLRPAALRGLIRTEARLGRTESASSAYRTLMREWSEADPDVLATLRAEIEHVLSGVPD